MYLCYPNNKNPTTPIKFFPMGCRILVDGRIPVQKEYGKEGSNIDFKDNHSKKD